MTAVIDAHQHFWDLKNAPPFDYSWLDAEQLSAIRRSFMPPDLLPWIQQTGIEQTVFVQTQHDIRENEWALNIADANSFVVGVVGWVDLASPDCEDQLLRFLEHPKFVGVRHITQDEPDDDFIVRDDIFRGLAVLQRHAVPFDLLFHVKHLRHASTLARRLPDLPLVIDHLAKPEIKARRTREWLQHLQQAAQYSNIHCKLSGLITEADWRDWKPADLRPYVELVLEAFGPHRCMFGSDWPVCELAGSYQQVYDALVEVIGPISDGERDAMFGGTAARFYGLGCN
jgi:L-fuconolactonase